MPRISTRNIDVALFDIGKPTRDGRIYPLELVERIAGQIATGKKFTIEEVSPVERELKKIQPYESWSEHAMAESTGCRIEDGVFHIEFQTKANKFGKLLCATLDSGNVKYFPVGIGEVGDDGVVSGYQLSYVSYDSI